MRAEARSTLDRSYAQHAPTCAALAYFITGDPSAATGIALRSFERAATRVQDLGDDSLEFRLLSQTVASALHRTRRHRPRPDGRDPLWDALLSLRARQRAALALTHFEDIDEFQAADLLACSPASIGSLVSTARRTLRVDVPVSDLDGRIRRLLEERARVLPERFQLGEETATRLVKRRRLTAAASVLIVVALFGLGAAGMQTLVERARAGSSQTQTFFEEPDATWEGEGFPRLARTCPRASALSPIPARTHVRAPAAVAVRLNRALIDKRLDLVRALLFDPAAFDAPWAHTQTKRRLRVTLSAPARNVDLVRATCGRAVARRTWKVVMHDANGTTARGLATFYLARVPEGWRAWGSYEPGP
jgi:DNA-directed RNA polymerase specialized sigma24 family protein